RHHPDPPAFPTRRSSDLHLTGILPEAQARGPTLFLLHRKEFYHILSPLVYVLELGTFLHVPTSIRRLMVHQRLPHTGGPHGSVRSEEHTSELQSRGHLVC